MRKERKPRGQHGVGVEQGKFRGGGRDCVARTLQPLSNAAAFHERVPRFMCLVLDVNTAARSVLSSACRHSVIRAYGSSASRAIVLSGKKATGTATQGGTKQRNDTSGTVAINRLILCRETKVSGESILRVCFSRCRYFSGKNFDT